MVDKTDTNKPPYKQELHPLEEFVRDGFLGRIKDHFNRCSCALSMTFAPVYVDFFENFYPTNMVREAFVLARRIHADDPPRLDGRAYITHPYGTYMIVRKAGLPEEARVLALLHDTNESIRDIVYDRNAGHRRKIKYIRRRLDEGELRKAFGDDLGIKLLSQIVAMTPPSKHYYNGSKKERDDLTFEAIADVSCMYPVVMAVRLADRLYNMTDLKHFREERQEELAHDTLRYTEWARSHLKELGSLTSKGERGVLEYLIKPNERIALRIIEIMEAKRREQITDDALDTRVLERSLQGQCNLL